MMIHRFCHIGLILFVGLVANPGFAQAAEPASNLQATLVWGTNDPEPADSKLKTVDPEVARKLGTLPFKWNYYYTVECKEFALEPGQRKKVSMSEECEILVKAGEEETIELALRGKGKLVGRITQKLPEKDMLVTGGNAENLTSWFVVLRRIR